MIRTLLSGLFLTLLFSCNNQDTQTPDQVKQELAQTGRRLVTAIQNKDMQTMKQYWADEYLSTGPEGTTATREQLMLAIENNVVELESLDVDDLYVRVFGHIAILTGHADAKAKINGEDYGGSYRATGIYIRREGRWQALGLQVTKTK